MYQVLMSTSRLLVCRVPADRVGLRIDFLAVKVYLYFETAPPERVFRESPPRSSAFPPCQSRRRIASRNRSGFGPGSGRRRGSPSSEWHHAVSSVLRLLRCCPR